MTTDNAPKVQLWSASAVQSDPTDKAMTIRDTKADRMPPLRRKGRYAQRLRMNLKPTPKARDLPTLWSIAQTSPSASVKEPS